MGSTAIKGVMAANAASKLVDEESRVMWEGTAAAQPINGGTAPTITYKQKDEWIMVRTQKPWSSEDAVPSAPIHVFHSVRGLLRVYAPAYKAMFATPKYATTGGQVAARTDAPATPVDTAHEREEVVDRRPMKNEMIL
jgi:hypothetical protein